jgi:hypothetical protein
MPEAISPDTGQHPCILADKILKVVGDADSSTARVALQIASLLLAHRDVAEAEFLRNTLTSP